MKRKLVINCADCDTRSVTEQFLENYDSVSINCAVILTDAHSREILSRNNVEMNCASVLDLEEDVKVRLVNGSCEINAGNEIPPVKQYLLVNGSMTIGPDTQNLLNQYTGILVNGSATYPKSMSGALWMMTVNGASSCYPDGAIILKRTAVIDKIFTLRAKKSLYWAEKRLIMVDPQLDPGALAAKGATFCGGEAIVAESKVEGMVERLDEKTEIIIVPDGTAVIQDDVVLDDTVLRKYGNKLYIIGDLTVEADAAAALEQVEYLNVRGDVSVIRDLKPLLEEKTVDISGDVKILSGRVIADLIDVKISRWLLEQEKDGICVTDCVKVVIDEDIPKETIFERLKINDCAKVVCTQAQLDAVTAICKDVAVIGEDKDDNENDAAPAAEEEFDTDVINCASYVL